MRPTYWIAASILSFGIFNRTGSGADCDGGTRVGTTAGVTVGVTRGVAGGGPTVTVAVAVAVAVMPL